MDRGQSRRLNRRLRRVQNDQRASRLQKGDADDAPTVASAFSIPRQIRIIRLTTAAWNVSSETPEGYTKSMNVDGNPDSKPSRTKANTARSG